MTSSPTSTSPNPSTLVSNENSNLHSRTESATFDPLMLLLSQPTPIDVVLRAEWDDDFRNNVNFFVTSQKRSRHGLRTCKLRAIHWRLSLGLLPSTSLDQWAAFLKSHRSEYDELLKRFKVLPSTHVEKQTASSNLTNNHTVSEVNSIVEDNPLSTSEQSVWSQYFHNTELSSTITMDLKRTHPESGFFQSPQIQELMLNILFVWAKLHPEYEYRQGMNELLAPIVLTIFRDSRNADLQASINQDDLLASLVDRNYAEHDIFMIFRAVMKIMAPYFAKSDNRQKSISTPALRTEKGDLIVEPVLSSIAVDSTPIVQQCNHIHHTLLCSLDPPLYRHLEHVEVQPQLYALRWFRLLFTREFHIEYVLFIWDVLFASSATTQDSNKFTMAEFLCVAMLYYVRGQLLQGDNTFCLRRLLKYPPVEDIRVLTDRASYFLDQAKGRDRTQKIPASFLSERSKSEDSLRNVSASLHKSVSSGRLSTSANDNPNIASKGDGILQSSAAALYSYKYPNNLSTALFTMLDMSETVSAVIQRLSNEYERVRKQRTLEKLLADSDALATPSVPVNEHVDGALQYDLSIVSSAVSELKHIKEVLNGSVAHTLKDRDWKDERFLPLTQATDSGSLKRSLGSESSSGSNGLTTTTASLSHRTLSSPSAATNSTARFFAPKGNPVPSTVSSVIQRQPMNASFASKYATTPLASSANSIASPPATSSLFDDTRPLSQSLSPPPPQSAVLTSLLGESPVSTKHAWDD